jgi:hypothetical protein
MLGLALAGPLGAAAADPSPAPKQALPDLSAQPAAADEAAADAPTPAAADDQGLPPLRNSGYIHLGLGARWFTGVDRDHLFLGNPLFGGLDAGTDSSNGSTDALNFEVALGYQHPSGLGLEVGLTVVPIDAVYAMPLFRVSGPGLGTRPALHTFGVQAGWGTIAGQYNSYYYYAYNSGDNYLAGDANFNTYAVCYRVEQMLNPRLSLGLELAYHFAWADVSYDHYDPNTSTTTNLHATLNYSGPSISLTLAAWPVAPFWTAKDQADVDQRQSRRERRLEARLEGIESRRSSRYDSAPDYDSATDAKAAGDRAMDNSRFKAAEAAYQQATLLAPGDTQGWRGLANAEYAEGKHARAFTHYKEALRLDPKDKDLRDFVEKLRVRLRQDLDLN